jgi:hypothetical protein
MFAAIRFTNQQLYPTKVTKFDDMTRDIILVAFRKHGVDYAMFTPIMVRDRYTLLELCYDYAAIVLGSIASLDDPGTFSFRGHVLAELDVDDLQLIALYLWLLTKERI